MAGMEGDKQFKSVSQLKSNGYLLVDDNVCRVKDIEKSKAGKHGSTKARITTVGLFDNQKRVILKPTSADIEVPVIEKGTAQIVAVMGSTLQIMDVQSYETTDIPNPKEISGLKSGSEIEYMRYGPKFKITRKK
jgi:translation initiation factor 5A